MNQIIQDALNKQLNEELYSSYLYLSMTAWLESKNLAGMAHWMRLQAREEVGHAIRLVDFIMDRDGKVELHAIDKPATGYESPLEVMQASLDHERKVSGWINEIYQRAVDESDYPSQVLLQWFVTEQVEEEKSAQEIVDRLTLAADSVSALLVIDDQLGQRQPGAEEEAAG